MYVRNLINSINESSFVCMWMTCLFDTDQEQVVSTKEFLSLKFFMKDTGEVDVILGIRIKQNREEISLNQCHYIEKMLTKFNSKGCCELRTPFDPSVKLVPNTRMAISPLEYSHVLGCLMYVMTS